MTHRGDPAVRGPGRAARRGRRQGAGAARRPPALRLEPRGARALRGGGRHRGRRAGAQAAGRARGDRASRRARSWRGPRAARERQDSVARGLRALPAELRRWWRCTTAARALVTPELVARVVADAVTHGAAIAAVPLEDTLKRVEPGRDRGHGAARGAVARADAAGVPARLARGGARPQARGAAPPTTRRWSRRWATRCASPRATAQLQDHDARRTWRWPRPGSPRAPARRLRWRCRVGIGYDIHRTVDGPPAGAGRRDDSRATGGSRATATPTCCCTRSATRCSARSRSATSGTHFPPGDPRWKDASSLELLRLIRALLAGARRDAS